LLWFFTARLKPCPSFSVFFRSLFSGSHVRANVRSG
jgi:hypothetical protein